jgi:hypothetical protein
MIIIIARGRRGEEGGGGVGWRQLKLFQIKGKMSQNFRLLVFFMNPFPPSPEFSIRTVLMFSKICTIFAAQK